MPSLTLADVLARSRNIVMRKVKGESILVPLVGRGADIDALYNLNPTGTFIWGRLNGRRSGAEIVQAMTQQFEVTATLAGADYLQFVDELTALGAVRKL